MLAGAAFSGVLSAYAIGASSPTRGGQLGAGHMEDYSSSSKSRPDIIRAPAFLAVSPSTP